jgi:hypothetical protein
LHSHRTYTTRSFNTYSVEEFKTRWSYESWGSIFGHNGNIDVDTLFKSFLSDYLRLFYTRTPPPPPPQKKPREVITIPG